MAQPELSCQNCGLKSCVDGSDRWPSFCPTPHCQKGLTDEVLALYREETDRKIAHAAAQVELEGYGIWPRVRETVEFARRLGCKKLGIATCVGLLRESRVLAGILEHHGFTVCVVGCKAGATPKAAIGLDAACNAVGGTLCNPILQARFLEEQGAELNILMGLCVGHDSLFYRHSAAPVTTLVAKDRVLGHNPAAALYHAEGYCKNALYGEKD